MARSLSIGRLAQRVQSSTVSRNTLLQLANQAVTLIVSLLSFTMIARALGASAYGSFGLASTYAAFVAIAIDGGLDIRLVKLMAFTSSSSPRLRHTQQLAADAIAIRLTLFVTSTLLVVGLTLVIEYPPVVLIAIIALALNGLLGALGLVLSDIYQARQEVRPGVLASFVAKTTAAALIASLFFADRLSILSLLAATLIGGVAGLLAILRVAFRDGLTLRPPTAKGARQLYAASASLAVFVVLGQIVHRSDVIVLSAVTLNSTLNMTNEYAVGIYVAAYRFFDLTIALPGIIVVSLAPRLAYLAANERVEFWSYLRTWTVRMTVGGIITGIFLAIGGVLALPLLAGPEFADSTQVVVILSISMPFVFLSATFFAAIVALDSQRYVVWAYVIVALLNVSTNFLLMPKFGYMIGAYVTTLSQVIIVVAMHLILRKGDLH